MSVSKFTALLGGWPGHRIGTITGSVESGALEIELIPTRWHRLRCPRCRKPATMHDFTTRRVRDLPVFDARTTLILQRRRLYCNNCGPQLEPLSWLNRYARVTTRLAESVARLCRVLPLAHVANFYALGWHTVKAIDKAYLHRTLGPIQLDGVEVIAMDEFAIQRGHRYATVVIDPTVKRVLWIGRGRSRDTLSVFFDLLGPERCAKIRAAVMDMSAAYSNETRARCPNVDIIYDLFHVVARYGKDVIDRVRVDEANRLRDDKKARKIIKSSRWLLLRNRDNIRNESDRIRLDELLAANKKLMTAYVLKDDLKQLWSYREPAAAQRAFDSWYRRAIRSRIEPLKRFARNLKVMLPGIIAHCIYPLSNGLLEGMNNKIKVIKRMSYGFRDDEYFFLRIRAAFPGIPR